MNEYFLIALSLGAGLTAGVIVFVMANWNDWRYPRQPAPCACPASLMTADASAL